MRLDRNALRLYAVTDRRWLGGVSLAFRVEAAIKAGVTMVQLREKDICFDDFLALAKEIKQVTERFGIPLIINDNVDIAIAAMADGVHLGQSDMHAAKARREIGENMILGLSARTRAEAVLAESMGADYIGAGAVFSTSTKSGAEIMPWERLKEICAAVSIPVVAIGGISKENVLELKGAGIEGIAVVSAIFAEKDEIVPSVKELRKLAEIVTGTEDIKRSLL